MKTPRWNRTGLIGVLLLLAGAVCVLIPSTRPVAAPLAAAGAVCILLMDGPPKWRWKGSIRESLRQ